MGNSLYDLAESTKEKLAFIATKKLIEQQKTARGLVDDLDLKSRQISRLLKRIERIKRDKDPSRNVYTYRVEPRPPEKISFGNKWIEVIEDENGNRVMKTSDGEEKIIEKNIDNSEGNK